MNKDGLTPLFDLQNRAVIDKGTDYTAETLAQLKKPGIAIRHDEQAHKLIFHAMSGAGIEPVRRADLLGDQWEKITDREALVLQQNVMTPGGYISAETTDKLPQSVFYKTGDGKLGILQLTGFTENPRGVKIRYKLVQSDGSVTVSASGFIRQSGTYQLGGGGGLALTPSSGGRVSLALTRADGAGRENFSIPDFFKKDGWFVYVESAERVWIFDGIRQLDVVATDGRYSAGDIGVRALCPNAVWDAVPGPVRKFYRETQSSGGGRAAGEISTDQIIVEDLALQMIVAIREKNDDKLRALASDRIKGWRDALPQFATELREHYRQNTGNEAFDLRASESLVDGDLAAVRCTCPAELKGKCLVLFFVKTADGWRNYSLRASMESVPLAEHLANIKKAIEKENAAAPTVTH